MPSRIFFFSRTECIDDLPDWRQAMWVVLGPCRFPDIFFDLDVSEIGPDAPGPPRQGTAPGIYSVLWGFYLGRSFSAGVLAPNPAMIRSLGMFQSSGELRSGL